MRKRDVRNDQQTKDSLNVLGLKSGVIPEQVKTAYRKRALETHPDKQGGSVVRFVQVKNAYDYLLHFGTGLHEDWRTNRPEKTSAYNMMDFVRWYNTAMGQRPQDQQFYAAFQQQQQSRMAAECKMRMRESRDRFKAKFNL
jgi:DnaJ-class molecular chaperone